MGEKHIISNIYDYWALPLGVLLDARLLAEGEVFKQSRNTPQPTARDRARVPKSRPAKTAVRA